MQRKWINYLILNKRNRPEIPDGFFVLKKGHPICVGFTPKKNPAFLQE